MDVHLSANVKALDTRSSRLSRTACTMPFKLTIDLEVHNSFSSRLRWVFLRKTLNPCFLFPSLPSYAPFRRPKQRAQRDRFPSNGPKTDPKLSSSGSWVSNNKKPTPVKTDPKLSHLQALGLENTQSELGLHSQLRSQSQVPGSGSLCASTCCCPS